jgi:hypothetical protein
MNTHNWCFRQYLFSWVDLALQHSFAQVPTGTAFAHLGCGGILFDWQAYHIFTVYCLCCFEKQIILLQKHTYHYSQNNINTFPA